MSMKMVKKFIAVTMAATLMVAPAITASAATETSAPVEATTEVQTTSQVSAGGTVIKTALPGAYLVKTLNGVAVKDSAAAIKAAAGLGAGETPYVKVYDITAKNSPLVYASFNACAAAVGGTVIAAVNIDFGKLSAGKFSALPGEVTGNVTVGVKNPPAGKTLAVVKVLPLGAAELIADADQNPNTVSFPISGGLGAYAVIAY